MHRKKNKIVLTLIFKKMVKNREELARMASEWVEFAKNDLRRQLIDFMQSVGTSAEELSYALAISQEEIEDILAGNGDFSLSTLAKILIATDNVLEIKPISEAPAPMMNPYGIPMRGRFQMPTQGRTRMQVPPYGMPMQDMMEQQVQRPSNRMSEQRRAPQARDDRGRFVATNQSSRRVAQTETPNMPPISRRELISLLRTHHWDDEIDIMNSTDYELFELLCQKGIFPPVAECGLKECNVHKKAENCSCMENRPSAESNEHSNRMRKDKIMQLISEEFDKNPQTFEALMRHLS